MLFLYICTKFCFVHILHALHVNPCSPSVVEQYNALINDYFKDGDLTLEELIVKVRARGEEQIGLLNHLQDIKDLRERIEADQVISKPLLDAMEKKEKRVKNFLKNLLRQNPHLEEVPERKDCDVILIFDEDDTKNYQMFFNDDFVDYTELIESGLFKVVYLKNTNKHNAKKTSYAFMKRNRPRNMCK